MKKALAAALLALLPGTALLAQPATPAVAEKAAPDDARGNVHARIDAVPGHPVRGLSAAEAQAFRSRVQRVADALAAQPAIGNPPAPVCTWLHPWIEQGVSDEGVAMATLLIDLPAT